MSDEKKFKINVYFFILWGSLMHLVVLWGVLDANFHSPILQGLPVTEAPRDPPAKRVFLFVADGLRFRTFIQDPPPYLRKMMHHKGVWGVSHTRMPTESRPGNVAIAAGLYEDPSALFKGWKENPVDFDSIFNQSSSTWAWGSPDIIPMFAKSSQKIHGKSYPHAWQDFDASAKSTLQLDSWVFEHFLEWLKRDANSVRDQQGVILFFHLLGCDTSGHTNKPYSKEYKENMKYVDREIEGVVQKTEEYFKDNGTAYVFTSDHGMTDWGSHGSGSTDETETPLVAWGAGIGQNDKRHDIEQADIAPFISSLLGLSIPVNNEGVLPRSYLKSGNEKYGAYALRSNVVQLSVQVKANRRVCSGEDPSNVHWREKEMEEKIFQMDQHLLNGRISEAIEEGEKAIVLGKESLSYHRRYQRNRFIFYLTLTWLGWIVLLLMKLINKENTRITESLKNTRHYRHRLTNLIFVVIAIIILIEDKLSGRPGWRVPGYGIAALVSVWLASRSVIEYSLYFVKKKDAWLSMPIIGTVLLIASMSVGLIFRWSFAIGMLITAAMQKILMREATPRLWLSAVILAVFPLLPVVGPNPRIYIVLASLSFAALFLAISKTLSKFLIVMELARLAITIMVVSGFIDGRSYVSWIILITTPFCICLYRKNLYNRIIGVVYGLLCPYALLSASYEPVFYLVLATHLLSWPPSGPTEKSTKFFENKSMTSRDVTRAAFYMLYTLLCFFGTGNMASISSFDPTWTRHFITVFSPFTMTSLIILKLGIPLILVGCSSRVFVSSSVFLSVLLLGDCLSLPLMYGITTQGSWLDIGSAISRYTIAITLPCLLLVLYHISQPLMTYNVPQMSSSAVEKKYLV
ncbi:GPI ethanolamine phosphate transferase 1 [Venturia canescens]|uniref:GPI ethanolamine phosphate transferase 1 n=1 Tax=Venturia canescens TaxID=32260 RepID=UPI001C9CE67A|nr:GPI ethanolamine phosphate transferase 1 [Venturia canescens]